MPVAAVSKYLIPDLPRADEVLPYLRRMDEARWYSNFGPLVCELEKRLQELLSGKIAHPRAAPVCLTTLVSGLHALEIGLRLRGIGPGKRTLVPAVTFPACPLAVQHAGAEPVLADIDPHNWTLTPRIARAAAQRTQIDAVMPVALYGVPVPALEWDEFTQDTGIPVIIDAAAALETQTIPQYCLVVHSLHATKPFGLGEGGVLAARDPELIAQARRYANFGLHQRVTCWNGSNAKMSEYHAAVGLAQWERWGGIKQRRRRLLQSYVEQIQPYGECVALQPAIDQAVVSLLMLRVKRSDAACLVARGQQAGIAFHQTYLPPLYRHDYFADLALVDTEGTSLAPNGDARRSQRHMLSSERLLAQLIGIPFHFAMTEEDVAAVVAALLATSISV